MPKGANVISSVQARRALVLLLAGGFFVTIGTSVASADSNAMPAFTSSPGDVVVAAGHATAFTVKASGTPKPSISEVDGPSWMTVTSTPAGGRAEVHAAPPPGSGGNYNVTFTAANGTGSAHSNSTVSVLEFTSAASATFTTGESSSFSVTTSLGSSNPILTATRLPRGLTFTNNGNGTGTLAGAAKGLADASKTYKFTFHARIGRTRVKQKFTLTVSPPAPGTVFSDNFGGSSLDSAWTVIDRHGEYAQDETECNVPQAVSVSDNILSITTTAQSRDLWRLQRRRQRERRAPAVAVHDRRRAMEELQLHLRHGHLQSQVPVKRH